MCRWAGVTGPTGSHGALCSKLLRRPANYPANSPLTGGDEHPRAVLTGDLVRLQSVASVMRGLLVVQLVASTLCPWVNVVNHEASGLGISERVVDLVPADTAWRLALGDGATVRVPQSGVARRCH